MRTHKVKQGSEEWHALRPEHFCASEAAAMLGLSPHLRRNELLHAKKTYSPKEFSEWAQKHLLDKGHEAEAATRSLAEAMVGEGLYPVTGSDIVEGMALLASFDGLTADDGICWENKLWNAELVRALQAGDLPDSNWPQVEQQLLLSKATRCLFTVSLDGTKEKTAELWYESKPERRDRVIAGWKQFREDLEAYVPVAAEPTKTAAPIKDLPAIIWTREAGKSLTHNLDVFKAAALQLVDDSKKTLETDQDFVDRDLLCKKFKATEDKIDLYKAQVLGEIEDVDAFSRGLTEIQELIRQARINGEKQITARKESIRIEILDKAKAALAAHVAKLNERLGKPYMPTVVADFAGAMKNKRTVLSLRDGVDTALSRAKIEANEHADRIQINLNKLRELAEAYKFLFSDAATIVLKPTEDLVILIEHRIGEHKRKEEARIEAERAKIRAEEEAKARAEAEARLRAENEAKAKEEAERLRKETELRAQSDAAEKVKRDAEEKARLEAEEATRREALQKAGGEAKPTPAAVATTLDMPQRVSPVAAVPASSKVSDIGTASLQAKKALRARIDQALDQMDEAELTKALTAAIAIVQAREPAVA